jgi:DNA invertase Pin-like site-specific DNA recombinase
MQLDAFRNTGCEKIYQEKVSAFRERPQLEAAINELRPGDTLYVWALDRLGRTVFEVVNNVKTIHDKDAHLMILYQNIDTSTPAGRMLVPIFSLLAELEIELKRERTLAGIKTAREAGRPLGRKPGLTPKAMEIAKQAKKLYLSKNPYYSIREITNILKISVRSLYKYIGLMGVKIGDMRVFGNPPEGTGETKEA